MAHKATDFKAFSKSFFGEECSDDLIRHTCL